MDPSATIGLTDGGGIKGREVLIKALRKSRARKRGHEVAIGLWESRGIGDRQRPEPFWGGPPRAGNGGEQQALPPSHAVDMADPLVLRRGRKASFAGRREFAV